MELSLPEARACVVRAAVAQRHRAASERVALTEAWGRFLAEEVLADRDQPPFARALRDGFAVRSADLAAATPLRVAGLIRAGDVSALTLHPGECVEIMTGAAVPAGADAVLMVEHATREDDCILPRRGLTPGENVAAAGSEARAGDGIVRAGQRVDAATLALLAAVGCIQPQVGVAPRVAVLPTGDELVAPETRPAATQIRNANGPALQALVRRAGGVPVVHTPAQDESSALQRSIQAALASPAPRILVLSGGVSAGKFDLVEPVLAAAGWQCQFDAVRLRPGKPCVFGTLGEILIFGLPGNPLSTMHTFELFVRPAIEILAGADPERLEPPWLGAALGFDYRGQDLPLTVFLPVRLRRGFDQGGIEAVPYHGSADLVAAAAADAYLVVPEHCTTLAKGTIAQVFPK